MSTEIRISGIVKESIVDGPGIRLVVFAQGCRHHCHGCHNPHTHSFQGGMMMEIEDIIKLMQSNPLLDGITFSGGEPFEQAVPFSKLAEKVKKLGYHVMTYTGYTYEYILQNKNSKPGWDPLFGLTDVLVDGKFEIEKKSMLLQFRGSVNQRIIDVQQSMRTNDIIQHQF